MNEMDLKFNKIVEFFSSLESNRNLEMLFDSLDVELRYTFGIVP